MKKIFDYLKQYLYEYRLVFLIYSIITIFFLSYNGYIFSVAFNNFFDGNILTKVFVDQKAILGQLIGILILFIIYFFKRKKNNNENIEPIERIIVNFLFLILFITWSVILIDFTYIFPDNSYIIELSRKFLNIDRKIFFSYPAFFLYEHYNFIFEKIIVYSYNFIPIILPLWVLYLVITKNINEIINLNKRLFIAMGIAIVMWFAVPIMEPLTMFVINIFKIGIPMELHNKIVLGPPSQFINKYTLSFARFWLDENNFRHAVSNFPSMHTIWGLIIASSIIFCTRNLDKRLKNTIKILCITIATANMFGAVYTLQHYGIDIIAGIIVFILVAIMNKRKLT
jgi:membrane-associated phospholipid phosphatase